MLIIGINAYHGDASCAALVDGKVVAAAEEERFNRIKHSAGFPSEAIRWAVSAAGARPSDIGLVAFARKPFACGFHKVLYGLRMPGAAINTLRHHGKSVGIANRLAEALAIQADQIEVRRVEHHMAHMSSTFFVSPFEEAVVLSVDGLGDFASAMWGVGRGNRIEARATVRFPHSLGTYYTALTQYLGFPKYGDEYKVMGLASYGEPEYLDEFRKIVTVPDEEGINFKLALDYFTHHKRIAEMTWEKGEPTISPVYSDYLVKRLGRPRQTADPVEDRHKNIASSMQARLEEVLLGMLRTLQRRTGLRNLCLAGGVAFNCVANGKIREKTGFRNVYVQPAAGDAGNAVGAATYIWHQVLGNPRDFVMSHAYWGPQFTNDQHAALLKAKEGEITRAGCNYFQVSDEQELHRRTATELVAGKVVGWFQGRMEWGPRALGNRSILADPRRVDMREVLNLKIKRREAFRPFAPSIIEEAVPEFFEESHASPFMQMAYNVRPEKRCVIPATTHVDGTGRLQTVNRDQNPTYYDLIAEFGRQTGVPVLLNTSFNENEPIACKPDEALDCFLRTGMDVLVLGNWWIQRISAQ